MPRLRKTTAKGPPALRSVGIWIDHREAVLVFVAGEEKELVRIPSHVERHAGHSADPSTHAPFESHLVRADDSRERRFTGQLARYYQRVVARIAGTEAVLIFGPGEAKGEFCRQLEKSGLEGRAVVLEAAERMTDGQLVRKVRRHFNLSPPLVAAVGVAAPHEQHH